MAENPPLPHLILTVAVPPPLPAQGLGLAVLPAGPQQGPGPRHPNTRQAGLILTMAWPGTLQGEGSLLGEAVAATVAPDRSTV